MDWKTTIVNGLIFGATLTSRRGSHTPFVQTGAETSDTGAEAIEMDSGHTLFLAEPDQEGGTGMKVRSLVVLSNFPYSIGYPPRVRHFCYCRQIN